MGGPPPSGAPATGPGPIARRRRRRLGRRVALAVLVVLAIAAAAAVGWLRSESALRFVLERATDAAGGRLAIEAPAGSLFGAVRASRVVWHDPSLTVSVEDASVAIDWRAALIGRLRIRDASAALVEVVTEPSDAAPSPPATLAPPIGVEVADARVDALVVREAGADAPLRLDGLHLAARYARGRWTLDTVAVRGPFGALQASGTVAGSAPFALDARALLETRVAGEPVAVDATAAGELASIALGLRTVVRDASLTARATLAPFDAVPLRAVDLTVAGLDPSRFADGAPAARIDGRLRAQAPPEAVAGGSAGPAAGGLPPLAGSVELHNARAGRLDQRLVPVASAQARFEIGAARVRLESFTLDGPAGRVDGDAALRLPAAGAPASVGLPDVELRVRTDALDLSRVHAALRPTALRGTVHAVPERGGLAIDGRLADGDLALEARARLDDARLTIARARLVARDGVAEFSGTAGVAPPHRFELAGAIDRLDPSRFADLPPGRLAGRWRAAGRLGDAPDVDARLTLDDSRWRGLPLSGHAAGRWTPDRITGVDTALRWGATTASARGDLGARGDRLDLSVEAPRLGELDARLGGRASIDAVLRDALRAPAGSVSLRGRELAGPGGARAGALELRVDVARPRALLDALARLGLPVADAAGAADAAGPSRGVAVPGGARSATPPGAAAAGARDVRRRAGTGDAAAADEPPVRATLSASALRIGDTAIERLDAGLAGDADAHRLEARVVSKAAGLDATLRAEGRLARGGPPAWSGRVLQASNAATPRWRLLAPAELAAGADGVAAGPLSVEVDGADGARIALETARWSDAGVRVVGEVTGVPLRWLGTAASERGIRLDAPDALRLGARVDLSGAPGAGGGLHGRIDVRRESGDLTIALPSADGGVDLRRAGLTRLDARVEIAEGVVRADVDVLGERIGSLRGRARAPLAWTAAGRPDTAVPLDGEVDVDVPSLAFTRALVGEAWRFDGALRAHVELGGRVDRPALHGLVEGRGLVAEQRELGMRLTDGTLVATITDQSVAIETLRFASGAGSVTMTGTLRPDERSEAVLTLDRMPIPLGAGQRLVLSGEARATLRGGRLGLRGALRADEGVIELTSYGAPRVSGDVIVVRDAAEAAARGGERAARRRGDPGTVVEPNGEADAGFRIVSDLRIDLGDRFRVFGAGIDARLEGELTLRGRLPDAPRLTGTVRIVQGTYTGFGQKLEIERGTLVFSGPVDNPAIDIVAFRRFLPVEAGVALTGTARAPRLALVSKPDVPDPDKLSWLVLGTGSDTARSGGQNAALQAAAATLLATADPSLAGPGIASTFGLDVLSIRTSQVGSSTGSTSAATSAQDSIVTLGKRLTDRLFVSYEQSLRGLQNLLRLQYEISERLSVRTRVGTENGVDLLWTYRYD